MQTDKAALPLRRDWFLIARGGDMVLKLHGSLDIGEDSSGGLVLNPPPGESLARMTVSDQELRLSVTALDMTLSNRGSPTVQYMTFEPTTRVRLKFPCNTLIISPDFMSGGQPLTDQEIDFLPIATPTLTLQRVEEPIILLEPDLHDPLSAELEDPFEPKPEDGFETSTKGLADEMPDEVSELIAAAHADDVPLLNTRAAVLEEEEITLELPTEQRPIFPQGEPQNETRASGIVTAGSPARASGFEDPTPAPQRSEQLRSPSRTIVRRLLIVGLIGAVLLVPQFLGESDVLSDPDRQPSAFVEPLPATTPDQTLRTVDEMRSGSAPPAGPVPEIHPYIDPIPPTQTLPVPLADASDAELAASAAAVETLLAEAQTLFDADSIVTPGRNAVKALIQLLTLDPGNEAGLRLMYLSAARLLDQARAAHAAGDEYLARNLVEEVLGFHPEFAEAKDLLSSWSHGPQAPVSDQSIRQPGLAEPGPPAPGEPGPDRPDSD